MKKLLALLLASIMLLSLSACGASQAPAPQDGGHGTDPQAAAPAAASPAEETPAEPEPAPPAYYIFEEKDALTRKYVDYYTDAPSLTEPALGLRLDYTTEYSYDGSDMQSEKTTYVTGAEYPFGYDLYVPADLYESDGSEYDHLQYEYDAAGELIRISGPASYDGAVLAVSELENGLVVRSSEQLDPDVAGSDMLVSEDLFTYDAEGRLLSRESYTYFNMLFYEAYPNPYHNLYEYNGSGLLTHWAYHSGTADFGVDIRYEYDDADELIRMTSERTGEGTETLEIRRDAEGRAIEAIRTSPDGTVTTHRYSYDEQGRILSDDVTGGTNELSFRLEYDDEGYPLSMSRYVDGNPGKTTAYKYEDEGYCLKMTCKPAFDEADLLGSSSTINFYERERRNAEGKIQWSHQYDLFVAGTNIRYQQIDCDYTYKTIQVRVPVDPANVEPISSVEELYPELRDSYGGLKVPTPDGSEQLTGVRLTSSRSGMLDILVRFVFDADGETAGVTTGFDNGIPYSNYQYEYDEQGRKVSESTEEYGYSYHYSYAEDGRSYTYIYDDPAHDYHYEGEEKLDDYAPAKLVRTSADKETGMTFEFTDEGLLASAAMGDYPPYTYTYQYEPGRDGSLSWIAIEQNGDYRGLLLEFDEHGYLSSYTRIGGFYPSLTFEYSYVPAD